MIPHCHLCKRKIDQVGGYLARVNEKGVDAIWECRPDCDAKLTQEDSLLLALGPDALIEKPDA